MSVSLQSAKDIEEEHPGKMQQGWLSDKISKQTSMRGNTFIADVYHSYSLWHDFKKKNLRYALNIIKK